MAISKNNPAIRDNLKLIIFCPHCEKQVIAVMEIPLEGKRKMIYKCQDPKCDFTYPVYKGSYKDLNHKWINKK